MSKLQRGKSDRLCIFSLFNLHFIPLTNLGPMYPLQRRVDRLVQAVEDQDLWRFLSHQRELEPEELDLPRKF